MLVSLLTMLISHATNLRNPIHNLRQDTINQLRNLNLHKNNHNHHLNHHNIIATAAYNRTTRRRKRRSGGSRRSLRQTLPNVKSTSSAQKFNTTVKARQPGLRLPTTPRISKHLTGLPNFRDTTRHKQQYSIRYHPSRRHD